MGITQLDIIRRQAEAAVQRQVSGEMARLRRNTSLVTELSSLAARAARAAAGQAARPLQGGGNAGRALDSAPPPMQAAAPPAPCADGYRRISPMQAIYTPPDYRRRLVKKGIGIALAALLGLGILWVLVRYSMLSL